MAGEHRSGKMDTRQKAEIRCASVLILIERHIAKFDLPKSVGSHFQEYGKTGILTATT
jgi:hypothetical protein